MMYRRIQIDIQSAAVLSYQGGGSGAARDSVDAVIQRKRKRKTEMNRTELNRINQTGNEIVKLRSIQC